MSKKLDDYVFLKHIGGVQRYWTGQLRIPEIIPENTVYVLKIIKVN